MITAIIIWTISLLCTLYSNCFENVRLFVDVIKSPINSLLINFDPRLKTKQRFKLINILKHFSAGVPVSLIL